MMKQQKLLKLAKMMTKFTPDELTSLLEVDRSDLIKLLSNLENTGQIKRISKNQYLYIDKKSTKKRDSLEGRNNLPEIKPVENNLESFDPPSLYIDITKDKNYDQYLLAPDWAKRKANKYLTVIEASRGLKGDDLKDFIKAWNEKYPEMKTAYSSVLKNRKLLLKHGVIALLARYNNSKQYKSNLNQELFNYFKRFYLTHEAIPLTKAVRLAKEKYLENHPEDKESRLPSIHSFKRRLLKEYSKDDIDDFRSISIKGAKSECKTSS